MRAAYSNYSAAVIGSMKIEIRYLTLSCARARHTRPAQKTNAHIAECTNTNDIIEFDRLNG